ncbi:alpha/beta hydrolase [Leeuwenhoekiella nanhaiensis]|uniref:Esterase n=1 Tax=Leeuwenhoekiella nanhaiensis TaxID=1655491 RepID=A0A2G1VSH1_9FLAO|nr:alpha/beta hydrolase-fold protein [Leeuwenhoekiella nanhaiensis]PHQ29733.1 esterase [Leeuwenhoekiella nanhaiensis]
MKTITYFLLFLVFSSQAQVLYESVPSNSLSEPRNIKIQLPRNYETNQDKSYPVIVVMDGDYLFEPVAGSVDYYSYWEDMPQAIVVGIMQPDRMSDTYYSDENFLPAETGAAFFEFVGMDLFPWLSKKYHLAPFNVVVGHDVTAAFSNYYLMKSPPLFSAYISLSPDLAPEMTNRLLPVFQNTENQLFYYQATGSEDIESLRESTLAFDQELKAIENDRFHYYFDDFENASHYSLAGRAIPNALEKVFSVYRPISKKEFNDVLLKSDSPYDYLVSKYETIENLFGLKDQIRINDFIAVAAALDKKADWEGFENLGKLARKEYPETILGAYYLGRALEGQGEPKKALRTYEGALVLKDVANINKDLLMMRAQRIKDDFGY